MDINKKRKEFIFNPAPSSSKDKNQYHSTRIRVGGVNGINMEQYNVEREYFYLTDPKQHKQIWNSGIQADEDGEILLFNDRQVTDLRSFKSYSVSDDVAANLLRLDKYLLIQVNPSGITGELKQWNVAELSKGFLWLLTQPIIEPQYLKIIGEYETNSLELADFWWSRPLHGMSEKEKREFVEYLKQGPGFEELAKVPCISAIIGNKSGSDPENKK